MNNLEAYKKMILIRTAEQEIANLYLAEKIMSFVHFYVGQEAVAVGVCEALMPADRVMGNHRSHGHYLAKGGDLRRMICELLGKEYGSSHGKGGSMHLIDKSVNFSGSTPILGSVVPLGTGSAFEQKYNNKKEVTAVFFGDGASEEGVVYESINIACLYSLPILFVIENNLYSVNSKLRERRGEKYNVEQIMTGIGAQYCKADGNDFDDVYAKASGLIAGLRSGKGPAVLECIAYRHMAHSAPIMDDKQGYREEDTLEKRLDVDSVKKLRAKLLAQGVSEEEILNIESEAKQKVASDIAFAKKAPYPAKESLGTDIYA
jgi:TPP-dependent pyruvate/acetoin dehydrogenase alpha subunit